MSPLTTFLCRLIGLFCILICVSMVAHKQATVEAVTALVHNPSLLMIVGVIGLVAGLAIVLGHSIWSGGALPVIVTLVGWLILIKGLLFLFLPPYAAVAFFEKLHYDQFFFEYAAISLIIGVYLTYAGFSTKRS